MSGFNFTTGLVVTGFTLQRGDLAVSQFNTITGHFFFQGNPPEKLRCS